MESVEIKRGIRSCEMNELNWQTASGGSSSVHQRERDAGLTNQCLNEEVLQENRGNGKNMEHVGACPSLYLKKTISESAYPELRLRLGLSTALVKT
jgi:hypothetical protein